MSARGHRSRRSASTVPIPRRGCLPICPEAANAITASRINFRLRHLSPKTSCFLLSQWLLLLCGTGLYFLAQVKGAMTELHRTYHSSTADELCHIAGRTIESLSNRYGLFHT
ncbi:hypothetical protein AOQ84DRAFT_192061 [Glonium stellatum]|uniref:Uncharacterized protein n=1 Tax=Glonium stellatum TaxID=574774 RepID=A0A8E2F6R0_9PEZI|nr:hypothetical protein AOQ84DRAFT_192061 [Glonium stellatum]